MPGGLAATLGAIQPLVVVLISAILIGRAPHPVQVLAGVAGVIGVGLLVLSPEARPDPVGVAAAIGGALSMAIGTVLIDRWGRMGTPLETTTWQLIFGGAMLLPVALLFEGLPPARAEEVLGYGWLMLIGHRLCLFRLDPRYRPIGTSADLSGARKSGCGDSHRCGCARRMVQPFSMGGHGAGDRGNGNGGFGRTTEALAGPAAPHRPARIPEELNPPSTTRTWPLM
jgi:hypothetical protein